MMTRAEVHAFIEGKGLYPATPYNLDEDDDVYRTVLHLPDGGFAVLDVHDYHYYVLLDWRGP